MKVESLERQVAGYSSLATDLAAANRQVSVLEEFKKLCLQKTAVGSSEKGRRLEDLTEDTLSDLFPDAVILRTTGIAHSGDFQLQFGSDKVLLECKNYSQTVNQAEIDKFISDLMGSSASVGLMVSLGSSIRGKRRVDVHRQKNKLVGFAVIQSEQDVPGIGIMIRSLLANQCIFDQASN